MNTMRKVQVSVTVGALAATFVHIVWPELAIDNVTIALLILAAIPWLVPLFKSLEIPGGWKFEFQDLEKTTERAVSAGLLDSGAESESSTDRSFQFRLVEDPYKVVSDVRIGIEHRLEELATIGGLELELRGSGYLLHTLVKHNLISPEQRSVLAEIIGMLNTVIHRPVLDYFAVKWVVESGPRLLQGLDVQIQRARNR